MAEHAHADSHMRDFEAHVKAVEEDLEYYRAKRFEPMVFFLHRRGILTLYDVLRAFRGLSSNQEAASSAPSAGSHTLEQRIRAVEDRLDDYVRGIALAAGNFGGLWGDRMVIEDTRIERGDYDPALRIAKKPHGGSLEERIERLNHDLDEYLMLLEAFIRAIVETGVATAEQLDGQRVTLRERKGWYGARIVARAWTDPEFKRDLIERGREAVRALGIPPGKLGVAENTPTVHNVVVCTLCSCYPYDLLGDTPWWYKHDSYKQRIVADPRATLAEMFGLQVPEDVTIQVYDSTSDIRWMVLPLRPAGTEGLSEEELAELITQESLIGVAEPLLPARLAGAGR